MWPCYSLFIRGSVRDCLVSIAFVGEEKNIRQDAVCNQYRVRKRTPVRRATLAGLAMLAVSSTHQ
jgi:hypothetical protein